MCVGLEQETGECLTTTTVSIAQNIMRQQCKARRRSHEECALTLGLCLALSSSSATMWTRSRRQDKCLGAGWAEQSLILASASRPLSRAAHVRAHVRARQGRVVSARLAPSPSPIPNDRLETSVVSAKINFVDTQLVPHTHTSAPRQTLELETSASQKREGSETCFRRLLSLKAKLLALCS